MNDSHWPGYPVLNYINLFLRTYMVVMFYFALGFEIGVVVTVILRC